MRYLRTIRLSVCAAVVGGVVGSRPGHAAAQLPNYGGQGPFAVQTEDVHFGSAGTEAKVAYPKLASGRMPVVVLGHGFSAGPENQIGWGEHFASYGFVAIAPKLCEGLCAPKPEDAPAIVEAALSFLRGPMAPAALVGHVDPSRFAFEGHSSGGQALIFAAALLKPDAVVLIDPVTGSNPIDQDTDLARRALARTCSPILTIYAEAHDALLSCNKKSLWRTFGTNTGGAATSAMLTGATHCDGENTPRDLCSAPFVGCGAGATAPHRERIAHYATAWLLANVNGDPAAAKAVQIDALVADAALRDSEAHPAPQAACLSSASGS